VTEPKTIGEYLRSARRRRRVSIDRAADDTRIRADFLMRMESDEFDYLAPAYVRGFLRSYARYLRVDPDPLLEEFDRRYGTERVDTDQIVALQRRNRRAPRERRRMNNWAVAAGVALSTLLVLAAVGYFSGPEREARDVAALTEETPSPEPEPEEQEAEPGDDPEEVIALGEGIELEIIASEARCWVQVFSDGDPDPAVTALLELGDAVSAEADESMTVVLGYAAGVELVVNGQNIGTIGTPGKEVIQLPDDVESLL
jgi:cytoskeleton protein RodZ